MKLMTEEITEEFLNRLTDRVIDSITDKLEELDISLDFIGAVLANTDATSLAGHQKKQGRMHVYRAPEDDQPNSNKD